MTLPVGGHAPAHLPLGRQLPLSSSDPFYTQEGATIGEFNGSSSISGVRAMTLSFTLVTSPYPTGYELNGLSDSGDWYQVVVADNWPGCNSGFEEITEVWNNVQGSGPVNCDPTLSFTAGDVVILGLNFTSSHNVCLDVRDVTAGGSHVLCQSQPDAGGTVFVPIPSVSDANGYFTGPMTEVVNQTASSCPQYSVMPRLDYRGPVGTWVTQYTSWSDEFDLFFTSICYTASSSLVTLPPGDLTTHFVDTASGTGYPSRWGGGQNLSLLDSSYGWRYETDVIPIDLVSLSADRTDVPTGSTVHLSATSSGGVSPYTWVWYVDNVRQSETGSQFNFTPMADGSYSVVADAIDARLNALAAASPVVVVASGPLVVQSISASPPSGGVDIGQPVTFTAVVQGGVGPRTYVWGGLPSGCTSRNVSALPCTPLGAGTFPVNVTVTDSNHTTVASPSFSYVVHPAPLASLGANVTELDVGQSTLFVTTVVGGAAPYLYTWNGVPSGCPALSNGTLLCAPTAAGTFNVQVTISDANGVIATTGTLSVVVHPAPSVVVSATPSATLEVGQTLRLIAAASGGSGGYHYLWSALPAGCVAGNSSVLTCAPTVDGRTVVSVGVTDTLGVTAQSNGILVTVVPRLTVLLTVSPGAVTAGDVITVTAAASGGVGTLHYAWSGIPPSCAAPPNASFGCAVQDTGSFTISVTVSDSGGVNATSSASLTVAPGPTPSGFLGLGLTEWAAIAGILVVVIALGIWGATRRRPPPDDADA